MMNARHLTVLALVCSLLPGCVERIMKIRTDPPEALVVVNDEEVGVSPVSFSFLWYGDYDIIIRKPGYQTLRTHYRIDPPWWQLPPFDLVVETMTTKMFRDEQELPVFTLTPAVPPTTREMIERAVEMRAGTATPAR